MVCVEYTEEHIKEMIKILGQKYGILRDILDLTNSQTDAIAQEELEILEKLTQEKQARIDSIEPLDNRFINLFLELKENLKINSMEQLNAQNLPAVSDLKEATSRVLEVIAEIGVIEKQNNEIMLKLIDKNKKQIKNIAHGKKALTAYASKPLNSPSYYIDKKK